MRTPVVVVIVVIFILSSEESLHILLHNYHLRLVLKVQPDRVRDHCEMEWHVSVTHVH